MPTRNENCTVPFTKLIKIVCIPYPPLREFINSHTTAGKITAYPQNMIWNDTYELFEFADIQEVYLNYSKIIKENPLKEKVIDMHTLTLTRKDNKDKIYESKLYHSDYYLPKFVYDSFSFTFQLELLSAYYNDFSLNYVISKNVTSKFMFTFESYYTANYEIQDYNNVLIVERNNEVTLFTNAYMNYMKLGYKFDEKNMNKQNVSNWVGVALSTIGAVASFVSSIYTGGAGVVAGVSLMTTATGGTIRAVQQAQQNDRNLAQKQLQLQAQATSISGASDLDLLKAYSQNVAKICYYGLSDEMSEALYNLFYYNGYATRRYFNDTLYTSERINFNFIQAEIEIYGSNRINEEHLEAIRQKWKEGVTIFHYYHEGFYQNDTTPYEYKQIYENWEKDLFNDVNNS